MKLWYQSLARRAQCGGYPAALRAILDSVKDLDPELHAAGIAGAGGFGDQYRYPEFIGTGEVLDNVQHAAREHYDAIGNIADPGVYEARKIADVPVLGPVRGGHAHGMHNGRLIPDTLLSTTVYAARAAECAPLRT